MYTKEVIRAIIFDCFGVLYRGSLTHLAELASPADQQAIRDLAHASDHGFMSHDEYFAQLAALVHKPAAEVEAIVRERHVRNEALMAFVRELHGRYKVGLLSNIGRGVMDELIPSEEQHELFDAVILSSDVGMVKPDPLMFELMAERLGCEPEQCVMVDDLPVNIDGADRVGMPGIIFTSLSQLRLELQRLLVEL